MDPLTLKDKPFIDTFLKARPHLLSAYAFENLFIWAPLFDIRYAVMSGRLCLFFKNDVGSFMPLPPLPSPARDAEGSGRDVARRCFEAMEEANRNKDISRIENIEEAEIDFFRRHGFRVYEKCREYVVATRDIAQYKGARFRHQRYLKHFFQKTGGIVFRDYEPGDKENVLALYRRWRDERRAKYDDAVYRGMLEDSLRALAYLLENIAGLDVRAKVLEKDGELCAFTSGFPICGEIFCVNFEVADLRNKGLPQYLFSEFAKDAGAWFEINMMDDAGLENLRRAKLSFHPRPVVSYTALLSS